MWESFKIKLCFNLKYVLIKNLTILNLHDIQTISEIFVAEYIKK